MGVSIRITFQIRTFYDEREVEDLMEELERRGGRLRHLRFGRHELLVPDGLDWLPFLRTLNDCRSIKDVTFEGNELEEMEASNS